MCAACAGEYADPDGRRFEHQTVCCPACGPLLQLVAPTHPTTYGEQALADARTVIREGGVIAVKGVGGYHLACDATNGYTVSMLRKRKQRGDEPFAVMVATLDDAQHVVDLTPAEGELLTSSGRPVVLARRHPGALAAAVAPGQGDLGVMLASEPLHHLLLGLPGDVAGPAALVMASGTVASEPIVTDDEEALVRLDGLADAWLAHDRLIHVPCDDSVTRAVAGARGTGPPLSRLRAVADRAALRHTALAGGLALTPRTPSASPRVGAPGCPATSETRTIRAAQREFVAAVEHLSKLTGIEPQAVAADRHPAYRSHGWARQHRGDRPLVLVQHHHAHLGSVMAENGHPGDEPIIGFAFDGTGYGEDGAVWGGEFLVADYARASRRAGHLAYAPLPGGDAGVRNPCRMALSHAAPARASPWDPSPASGREPAPPPRTFGLLGPPAGDRAAAASRRRAWGGSSTRRRVPGRASATGSAYEAEAADAASEARARAVALDPTWTGRTRVFGLGDDLAADPAPVVCVRSCGRRDGRGRRPGAGGRAVPAARWPTWWSTAAGRLRAETNLIDAVGLCGGVFLNVLPHPRLRTNGLTTGGFDVLTHHQVPASDAGIALGQLAVLAHRGVATTDEGGRARRNRRNHVPSSARTGCSRSRSVTARGSPRWTSAG